MDFGKIEQLLQDEQSTPTEIKVIGVGGAGGNAVNRMIFSGLKKVTYVAMNTDVQALQRSNAKIRMPIGKELTGGLGAGGVPDVGEKAAIESKDEIKELLTGTDMVFITAGMGGGTGTGAAAVVAEIAKSVGALTVAVVTTPFDFEGKKKFILAEKGIERLRNNVDTLILIPNQYLLKVVENNTPIKQAFLMADDVLRQGVQGISELITEPGEINIDFADVKTVMQGKGDALMGIGIGEGANRGVDAAISAITNPLLEGIKINGAQSVLINLSGDETLTLQEYHEVLNIVTEKCSDDALVIAGQTFNPNLNKQLKVTVIATGFDNNSDLSKLQVNMNVATSQYKAKQPLYDRQQNNNSTNVNKSKSQINNDGNKEVVRLTRWQDLQQEMRHGGSASDKSRPAILRFSRDDN